MISSFYKNILAAILFLSAMFVVAQEKSGIASPMKDVNQVIDLTLDSLNKAITARPIAGSSRKGGNPVLFLVGNSTMRTGTLGNGNSGQGGWGYFAHAYFVNNQFTVANHALGGTIRTTLYQWLWLHVLLCVRIVVCVLISLALFDIVPSLSGLSV